MMECATVNFILNMVSKKEDIFDILNISAQLLMVIASFITIIITLNEIRDSKREKIIATFGVRCEQSGGKWNMYLGIYITNLSTFPVYIKKCGIKFIGKKGEKIDETIIFCDHQFLISPGEAKEIEDENVVALFNEEMKECMDKRVYVYVMTSRNKKIMKKTEFKYSDIVQQKKWVCQHEHCVPTL